jgi:hypothetical protein
VWFRGVAGKHYDTKHLIPKTGPDGKPTRVNFTMEEVHIDAAKKVRREGRAAIQVHLTPYEASQMHLTPYEAS